MMSDNEVSPSTGGGLSGRSTQRSPTYNRMVVDAYEMPQKYDVFATLFGWILFAGFAVFPGTFTSLKKADLLSQSQTGQLVQTAVRNAPLLYIAVASCMIGCAGIGWLWWRISRNYVWLMSRIFL